MNSSQNPESTAAEISRQTAPETLTPALSHRMGEGDEKRAQSATENSNAPGGPEQQQQHQHQQNQHMNTPDQKSETRVPKSEISPKPEFRIPSLRLRSRGGRSRS
jgi:hypothetical protein